MTLVGVITTVKIQQTDSRLLVTIPADAVNLLNLSKGDTLIVRTSGKDLKYRKVE